MGHTSLFGRSLQSTSAATSLATCLRTVSISFALLGALIGTLGCGGGGHATSVPSAPLVIVTPPASQTVPLGSSGTFTVSATGQGTLSYQWTLNGTDISGATGASYTTPPTALSDNGGVYAVIVTDADNSATGGPAKLTIGARSPKPGDIRFQQVDTADVALEGTGQEAVTNIIIAGNHSAVTAAGFSGSPLYIAPADWNCDTLVATPDCSWNFETVNIPSTAPVIAMYYACDGLEFLSDDLASLPSSVSVVTSMDMPLNVDAYAMAVTGNSQNTGFDLNHEVVTAAAVQASVNTDGLKSRVVTAASFDSKGMAHLFSYGWQGDTTTLYDTTTQIVAPSQVQSAATTLAGQGYIITAFGGNEANGYILVGTKVQGDTLPRPILVQSDTSSPNPPATLNGYATVGILQYRDPVTQMGLDTVFILEH